MTLQCEFPHKKGEYTVCLSEEQPLTLTSSARRYMRFGLAWVMSEACVKAGWVRSPFSRPCCYFWSQLCDQLQGPGVRWWAEMGLTQKQPEFSVSNAESGWGPSACPLSHCLNGVLVVGLGASRVKEQVNLPALKA